MWVIQGCVHTGKRKRQGENGGEARGEGGKQEEEAQKLEPL